MDRQSQSERRRGRSVIIEDAGRIAGPSGKMRRRLEASFAGSVPTAADPKSAELLRLIADVLRWINERCALWHESAYAHATLKAAFAALLEPYRPEGEDRKSTT